MVERRDEEPVRHETTVIQTGERTGSGGMVAALFGLLAVGLLALLFFGGYLGRAVDKTDIDVNVAAPNIELPDVQITPPSSEPANKSN